MNKMLIAAPLALAATALFTVPASAAAANGGQIRAEIQQLDRQIERSRGLSRLEEARLNSQVTRLQSLYRSYARGGFTRTELRQLDRQVTSVRAQITDKARDNHDYRNDRR
ncbi:MAG: hypothetical protein P1U62_11605 [Alteraurantiacibacter sp. bin_em_oilr2.035]|nr:hypothetical protein [Aurantiacibacter atlanticus]MDF1835509.1 hypothetical protein [Alteraurantiacibacter sp. bin_em_oilr2.035]